MDLRWLCTKEGCKIEETLESVFYGTILRV